MAKSLIFLMLLSLFIIVAVPYHSSSYILPSAQIIELMANKFAHVKTLQITQITEIIDLHEEIEKVFGESVYLMSPDIYRSEIAGQPGKRIVIRNGSKTLRIINGEVTYDKESKGLLFHFLMLAQDPKQILGRLQELGINLDMVSLTRFEGRIAYLIGDKEEGSPRLLVDKDLFLPLLLQYDNVIFRASDYRKLMEQLWYPYHINYEFTGATIEDYLKEEYTIKDVIVNPPINESLFDIPLIRTQFGKRGLKPYNQ